MRILLLSSLLAFCIVSNAQSLTVYDSNLDVIGTTERLIEIIQGKDLIYFETVSHDDIAEKRGYDIPHTKVILFEDPDLTTRLIQCEQTVGLDLPLKIMVWEENEDVYIGYLDPQLMRRRFLITGCDDVLTQMSNLMLRIVNESRRSR